MGDHAVGCHKQGELITLHNSLRDDLFRSAAQAGLSPTREERNLLAAQVDRDNQRPGDVKVRNWDGGQTAVWDVCVTSPLQLSDQILKAAARKAGSALDTALTKKNNKFAQACREEGYQFIALPVETLGGWHPQAQAVIIRLGGLAALATGGDKDVVTKQLFQKLAVSLVRGNASLILSRIPSHPSPDLDGDIDLDF